MRHAAACVLYISKQVYPFGKIVALLLQHPN